MKCMFFFGIVLLATGARCTHLSSIVHTDKGPVRGKHMRTIFHQQEFTAFFGIPFAKPPVDDLRFKDPVEIDPWTDVINAVDESPICIQALATAPLGSEDCLYLNVYTPVLDLENIDELKPVLVWIYGGAFELGMNLKAVFGPDHFLEEDIIMVIPNYRLGALGFLSLGLPDASGNQGLKDQSLAIQWVQKNIAKFGGDPNRVTIMGESAGAASVLNHVLSPMSSGLFQQAIAHSGTPLCPWAFKTPVESIMIAHTLGASLGIVSVSNEELLARLKQVDAMDLVEMAGVIGAISTITPIIIPWAPTYEINSPKPFLSDCPLSYLESGNFTKVPILMGYNHDESELFAIVMEAFREEIFSIFNTVNRVTKGAISSLSNLVHVLANGTEAEVLELANSFMFDGPIDLTQKLLAEHSGRNSIYYFRLSYNTKHNWHRLFEPNLPGTAHTDDVPLFFPVNIINPTNPDNPYNVYSKRLVTMWANFIRYGNPTPAKSGKCDSKWVRSGRKGLQIDLGNELFEMHDRFLSSEDEIYQQAYHTVLPFVSGCRSVVDPSALVASIVDPSVVNPAVVDPSIVNPAVVNPAVVDPAVVVPSVVHPAVVNPAKVL